MVVRLSGGLSPRDVRAGFGVSRERMARLLDVSTKTVERWEARDAPPTNPSVRARLANLREIVELGLVVYTAEGFNDFLSTPLGEFDRRTPLQLIEQGAMDDVLAALAADYEGLGF